MRKFTIVSVAFLILAAVLYAIPCTRQFEQCFFFDRGNDFLADFLNCVNSLSLLRGRDFSPYHNWLMASFEQIYPPFAYVLLLPFVPLMPDSGMSISECHASLQCILVGLTGVAVMASVFFAALCLLCDRVGLSRWMALLFFVSGQSLWCYERGNTVLLAVSSIIVFQCFFQDDRPWLRFFAALGLAFAVALKVTPVMFGIVWLNRKDFRWLFLAGLLTIALSFIPLCWSNHTIIESIVQLLSNVSEHERIYELGSLAVNPSCVLGMFIRQVLGFDTSKHPISTIVLVAKIGCIILGLGGLLIAAYFNISRWQKLFLLASSQILIPAAPQQYVYLFMFPVLAVLLSGRDGSAESALRSAKTHESLTLLRVALIVMFIVLMVPIPLFVFHGVNVSFAIQSILILLLVGCLVLRALRDFVFRFSAHN